MQEKTRQSDWLQSAFPSQILKKLRPERKRERDFLSNPTLHPGRLCNPRNRFAVVLLQRIDELIDRVFTIH